MSEATAESNEVEERSAEVYERDVDTLADESEENPRSELVKFGLLVVVLLFTVLIVALIRPLIFNKIVPAVLGEGQPVAPLVTGDEAETIKPTTPEAGEGDAAVEEGVEEEDTAVSPTESTPAAPEPQNPEDFPTAVPTQNHTVQAGETLTAIAQQYGVTVQAIVAANSITNPDNVAVGTVLIIPEGQ